MILNTKKSLLDSYLDNSNDLSNNSYDFKTDINKTTILYDTN